MKNFSLKTMIILFGMTLIFASCGDKGGKKGATTGSGEFGAPRGNESFADVVKRRDLNADDVLAAAKTYTPDKISDEYIALNSGGQAGSLPTYMVPSMRLVRYPVNAARQPYNGFGYSKESMERMKTGFIDGAEILWGDTHHPGYSETNGVYNGKWAAINDKANPRVYIYSLKDWELKQTVMNPIFRNEHGGAFFTPNSEYIMEACQYPAPYDHKYHPLSEENFKKIWRGGLTYWKFDVEKGQIDMSKSFDFELPPYTQDLSDAGKKASYGWGFTNSFCSEMYYGGIESGRPPFEAGCSSRDVDYLHITNWKKAEELFKAGKIGRKVIRGMHVITIEESKKYGLLYLVPEPKSPHGVDVNPTGEYIIVAGKLDSHAWVYSFEKIKKAIEEKNFSGTDKFGIPVIKLEDALHKSVEVGLGPLHNQYDKTPGVVYTSIYVDSRITKWNYIEGKVLGFVPSHYNVGHLVAAHGDSREPHGKYLISLDKLSIDRFNPVGPLHPQNHQLIDISGDKMKVIYDMPLPLGEPHYTSLINFNFFKDIDVYPVGTNIYKYTGASTDYKSPYATTAGGEKVETKGNTVHVYATINNGKVTPGNIKVTQGQDVEIHITNLGQSKLDHYVYEVALYDQMYRWRPGETATIAFKAEKAGAYPLLLDKIHSPEGRSLVGYLTVEPNAKAENAKLLAYSKRIQWDNLMQAFKPSAIELKNLMTGELEFLNYGCNACHKFGEDFNGPDLLMVDKRRSDKWLEEWILDPDSHFKDADVQALYKRFKLKMPNQNVSKDDVKKIIEYMKAKSKKAMEG